MLMVLDYALYYIWCLFIYYCVNKIGQKFTDTKFFKIQTYDVYGIGVLSVLMYVWLYSTNGYFIT